MSPVWTQAGSGFYVSGEVGANVASGLDTTGTSNDRASWCDEYINPRYQEYERCTGPDRSVGGRWENEFDGATGILAGAAVGYSFAGQNQNSPWGGFAWNWNISTGNQTMIRQPTFLLGWVTRAETQG